MRNFHCDAIFRRLIILVTLQTAGDDRKGTDIRLQNSSWNGTCLLPREYKLRVEPAKCLEFQSYQMDVKGGKILRKWLGKTNIDRWQFYMQHTSRLLLSLMSVETPTRAWRFARSPSWSISSVWNVSEFSVTTAHFMIPLTCTTWKARQQQQLPRRKQRGALRDFENTCTVHHC